ncbi:MAG: peptide/nickel transport system permease protein [Actinomycetota bacterium]|jgi:ABC-type dipeptide/oligopeptide/nickel transport system permease component|nr:peptide/nickel transport system permease protein [Actinomycetota bacterium]MDQ1574753.1 peptide/nickel transport system permease protein [Actinomycetota bacterium]
MIAYLCKRVAGLVALLIAISILVFMIIRLIPGNPALVILGTAGGNPATVARLDHQLGLDQPVVVQYFKWVGGVLTGNFGYSYSQQRSVSSLLAANIGPTIQLTVAALILALFFGTIIGVAAAMRRNSRFDTISMGFAITAMSIPSFWLGLVLLILFADVFPIFNVIGGPGLKGLVLPAVTLSMAEAGFIARFVRSSVIEAERQKHVTVARAKGISASAVLFRHILRNSTLPVLTVVGIQFGNLVAGTVIVETVFSRQGIGRLLVNAIVGKDYPTVQATVLLIAVLYSLVNFIVDMLYPILDRRAARW